MFVDPETDRDVLIITTNKGRNDLVGVRLLAIASGELEELMDSAWDLGVEGLDEVVADVALAEAADVNNGGLERQIEYLLRHAGFKHAKRWIEEVASAQEPQPTNNPGIDYESRWRELNDRRRLEERYE
jgi:hypothetical protein